MLLSSGCKINLGLTITGRRADGYHELVVFVDGLLSGSLAFGGEESAGASFLRMDGGVWSTDKDGFIMSLLAAEITAGTGKSPSELYDAMTARYGCPCYSRKDAPATREEKDKLKKLSPADVTAETLAGEKITAKLTNAPGNGAPIDGLKVTTENGWFAARPSGTEDIYKIYAESFKGEEHLEKINEEARAIVKQPKDAEKILRSLCTEMDERYDLLSRAGVNNIKLYNQKYKDRRLRPDQGHRYLPYLVVIIDEYADLTMTQGAAPESKALGRSITNSVVRLAQKGRAAGLHVILATQRPSVDVISGLIKSNFPMRIAFRTASRTDSSTILDTPGAEKLIGNGDMLFSPGLETERIQCGYISGSETETLTRSISEQKGYGRSYNTPYYLPEVSESGSEGSGSDPGSIDMHSLDSRFEEAARMVVTSQRGSTSDLQRKLGMGYARAGKVMDQLEAAGIVGPQEGSKPRQVLIGDLDSLEPILDAYLHKG